MRIGIDLGGNQNRSHSAERAGEQLFRHRLPTPRDDYRQTIETIAPLVAMAEQATGQTGDRGDGDPWLHFAVYRRGEKRQLHLAQRSAV